MFQSEDATPERLLEAKWAQCPKRRNVSSPHGGSMGFIPAVTEENLPPYGGSVFGEALFVASLR